MIVLDRTAPPSDTSGQLVRYALDHLLNQPVYAHERIRDLLQCAMFEEVDLVVRQRATDLLEVDGYRIIVKRAGVGDDARFLVIATARHSTERLLLTCGDGRRADWFRVLLQIPGAREEKARFRWGKTSLVTPVIAIPWKCVAAALAAKVNCRRAS